MKGFFVSIFAVLTLLAIAPSAGAHQGPAGPDALLSSGDLYRQEQALQNALEYNRTAHGKVWVNRETGHRGRVTPILTYKNSAGQDCRKFERSLIVDGRVALGHGTRCRTRNGVWKVPRLVYSYWDHHPGPYYYHRPYYYDPYYPPYRYPYYPFTIQLGYTFGHFSGYHRHWHHWHH